ncbi:MAG: hypothetical protein R2706_11365 [Acidimicrobiales bacterium]
MTTKLAGDKTAFLPFNRGDNQEPATWPVTATAPATCGRRCGSATPGWT